MNKILIASVFILAILSKTNGLECYECTIASPNYEDHAETIKNDCGRFENGKNRMKVAKCRKRHHSKFCATYSYEIDNQTMFMKGCLPEDHESKCNTTTRFTALNCCYGNLCNAYDKSCALKLYSQSVLLFTVFVIFLYNKLCDIESFIA